MTYRKLCYIAFLSLSLSLLSCDDKPKPPGVSTDFPGYVRDTGSRRTGVIVFVHGVIGNAHSTWTNEKSARFKITEQSLERLQSKGVPGDVLENLQDIKNQEATEKEQFLDSLKATLGEEQSVQYKSAILEHAEKSKAFWPQLLTEDETFNGFNIYVYEYPSPLFRNSLNPDEVAENMRLRLKDAGIIDHSEIIFLVHSMGGIVTRSYLQKYQDVADRVRFIYFFATPTEGAEIARLGKFLSQNPQFGKMVPIDADSHLADLMRSWQAARFGIKSFCAYEKQPVSSIGIIVDMASATALCTEPPDPIDATHIDIVKPADLKSDSYIAFRNGFRETRPFMAINIVDDTTFEDAVRAAVMMDRSERATRSVRFVNCKPDQKSARLRSGEVGAASTTLLIQRVASREGMDFFGLRVKLDERSKVYVVECIEHNDGD